MIGNDVIDLALARKESNWQRKGWLQKLFTHSEQYLIAESENPEILVWIFWSMKESAYKIFNRETKIRAFNPQQFVCEKPVLSDGFFYGKIERDGKSYDSKTSANTDFIHTVSVASELNIENVNDCILGNYNTLSFQKDEYGFPFVESYEDSKKISISVSHHGRFFSCAAFENPFSGMELVDAQPRFQF